MKPKKLFAALALALGSFAASAQSLEDLKPYEGKLPEIMQISKDQGALDVFKKFQAAGGLDGWLVRERASGKPVIVYSTPDGKAVLAGLLMDTTGKNLTAAYGAEHIPAPDYDSALADFNAAPSVLVGSPKAKAEVTVAFDANCGYCKVMHRLLAPSVEAGELRVRYVPVAILGRDSDKKGAGLLAAKNKASALDATIKGGAELSSDSGLLAKVRANTDLMSKHGFEGTPVVLYKVGKPEGETVFVANGVPDMNTFFKRLEISGQIDKLKKEKDLVRFLE